MSRPHIVILGAGFGGTYVAKKLARLVILGEIDITIVNKTNYFLFTPLLHEVATGSLSPRSVAEPLREIFVHTGICICQGTVKSINRKDRRVHIMGNGVEHTLIYDYLIIATGAESNYYGIPGAQENTLPLKTLADASTIRTRIIDSFEKAIVTEDPNERKHLLSFAVVGGGPTGVETAAELVEFATGIIDRYYYINRECDRDEITISLVHTGTELLQQFNMTLRRSAEERLRQHNVKLHLGKTVSAVTPQGLTLADGTNVPAATVIWAAGVKAIIPEFTDEAPKMAFGRLAVDEYFRLENDEHVFALGDVAAYIDKDNIQPDKDGKPVPPGPVPMLAQATVQQASILAKNIMAAVKNQPLNKFHFHSLGSMVSVGQWFAVGEIYSLDIAGHFTWWLWRTVYLFKFASWKKRIRIAFEWALDSFTPRDVTKLT